MRQMTIRETLDHEQEEQTEPYRLYLISDSETILYVGQSAKPAERLRSHLGLDWW